MTPLASRSSFEASIGPKSSPSPDAAGVSFCISLRQPTVTLASASHLELDSFHKMEQFALSAQHSGVINHIHSFHFNSSLVDAFKEVRLAVGFVVAGWVAVTAIRGLQGGFMRREGR